MPPLLLLPDTPIQELTFHSKLGISAVFQNDDHENAASQGDASDSHDDVHLETEDTWEAQLQRTDRSIGHRASLDPAPGSREGQRLLLQRCRPAEAAASLQTRKQPLEAEGC